MWCVNLWVGFHEYRLRTSDVIQRHILLQDVARILEAVMGCDEIRRTRRPKNHVQLVPEAHCLHMRTPIVVLLPTASPKLEVSAVDGPEDSLVEAVDAANDAERESFSELPR